MGDVPKDKGRPRHVKVASKELFLCQMTSWEILDMPLAALNFTVCP